MSRHDQPFNGLNWVKGEIEESLKQAQRALEAYVEDPNDTTQLRFCHTYVHQVRGTLQMIELYGAVLLAEEMETVLQALLADRIAKREDAYEVLMRAMLQLPNYLERVQAGHKDIPLVLLPLLNDLRVASSQHLLSETVFFSPDLSVETPAPAPLTEEEARAEKEAAQEADAQARRRRLRQVFQISQVKWYRNHQDGAALGQMTQVLKLLERTLPDSSGNQIWWVARGLLEAIADRGLEVSLAVKALVGDIDREIKRLLEAGPQEFAASPPTDVIKNMLFYIGRSVSRGPLVSAIRDAFDLNRLLPSEEEIDQARGTLGGHNQQLLAAVSAALQEELLKIKDALDLYVRNPADSLTTLEAVEKNLRQVADTLGMLGEGLLRGRILDQADYLRLALGGGAEINEAGLMKIAGALLFAESSLAGMAQAAPGAESFDEMAAEGTLLPEAEYHQLIQDVINEAKQDIGQIKAAIADFAHLPDNPGLLREVPALLAQVRGGLVLLGVSKPGELLTGCRRFIEQRLLGPGVPASKIQIDLLADTVTSIEYYLESLAERRSDRPEILAFGQHALDALLRQQPEAPAAPVPAPAAPRVHEEALGAELGQVFIEEACEEIDNIRHQLALWQADPEDQAALATLRRAFHTLKGSGRLVGAHAIGDFAWAIENMLNRVIDGTVRHGPQMMELLGHAADALPRMVEHFRQGHAEVDFTGGMTELAQRLATPAPVEVPAAAPLQAGIQMEEVLTSAESPGLPLTSAMEAVAETPAEEVFAPAQALPSETAAPMEQPILAEPAAETVVEFMPQAAAEAAPAQEEEDEVAREAREIFVEEAREETANIARELARWEADPANHQALTLLRRSFHTIKGSGRMAGATVIGEFAWAIEHMLNRLIEGAIVQGAPLLALLHRAAQRLPELIGEFEQRRPAAHDIEALCLEADRIAAAAPETPAPAPAPVPAAPVEAPAPAAPRLSEVVTVFLEEAEEILARIDALLHEHAETPSGGDWLWELQRDLHTLKGSARMADLTAIGDLGHTLESLLAAIGEGRIAICAPLVQFLQTCHDRLHHMVERVQGHAAPEPAQDLIAQVEEWLEQPQLLARPEAPRQAVAELPQAAEPRAVRRPGASAQGEAVRIRAGVLDKLVTSSAELGIYKSRLSQQLGSAAGSLRELEETISRIQHQMRILEIETESQMQHRSAAQDVDRHTEFDSLEFDRFSQMHQLTRSLMEGVHDLASINKLLDGHLRDATVLLEQQDRHHNELHEDLMRTRMVPFSGIAPRLRRLVRQTADALHKQVELEIHGEQSELDRSVLGRILPALEHLLRNAVDHGIESAPERQRAGKKPGGLITLNLHQIGSRIVIKIGDDGRGIDVDGVRRQAIERGLMRHDQRLSDAEAVQFILEAGFSTAAALTQISGRGVGLDVVNTEVRQLNGTLQIDSTQGLGTTFTISLPLTLATQQALIVSLAHNTYALPLAGFRGIARLLHEQLDTLFRQKTPVYQHGGEEYTLVSLINLLGIGESTPADRRRRKTAPLLLYRFNEQNIALHVESLLGHHDIVLKPVGPQLNTLPGISGGTTLGDGRVVLVLNLARLLQGDALGRRRAQAAPLPAEAAAGQLSVLVVDDSITVRKVTARLLERNGMQAVTAKDGVDALEQLQVYTPDIILLDIEMPRMDGFEFAALIREDERLRHIPIVMITSRTGEKHRERAMALGVDRYLGKPYKEHELLDGIHELTAARH